MVITLNNKQYNVKEAKTEEERRQGLKGVKDLPEDEGMLFYFDPPQEVSMTMLYTLIPLDQIFINEDQEVIKVATREPMDKSLVTVLDTAYVLELNANSGVSIGDELEFEEDTPIMKVLAPDGSEQMALWGGERIFRRAFTKQLIKLVKQADSIKNDSEQFTKLCKRIGKKMFKEIKAQDARDPEYVQLPN